MHKAGSLADGRPFLAMKLLRGQTLNQKMKEMVADIHQRMSILLPIFEQIALTVGYAHAQGIIHRDLKPANQNIHREICSTEKICEIDRALEDVVVGRLKPVTLEAAVAIARVAAHPHR